MPRRTRAHARFLFDSFEPRLLLTSYYVSPTGSDAALGTSIGAAWKTISKANTVNLDAGDQLLFQGGATFSGSLSFDASDSGASGNPVTIGSYGSGRATINAGDASGLIARDVAYVSIQDLQFIGNWNGLAATGTNNGNGIVFVTDLSANAKVTYTRVNNVDVAGFKNAGLLVYSENGKAGFTDLRITNSSMHDNGDAGIDIAGNFNAASLLYANSNVYVGYCNAYNNGGLPGKSNHSGDGIVIGDIDGGTIERCVAWNNGLNNNYASGGPVGIWAWDSNNITIQFNESYNNQTGSSSLDGGGFDLDGGVTNSVMQYNYSHGNDGAGYLLYQFTNARAFGNNTVRYNISQNDGRQGHYSGIYLGGGSAIVNNQVYSNTVYLTPTGDNQLAAVKITGVGTGNKLRNNIFYTTSSVPLLTTDTTYATASVLFQGNDWYAGGASTAIKWGATTYTSLSSWRTATFQEMNGATNTGTNANPNLVSAGGGGTFGDATRIGTLVAYQLLPASPVINAGVNLVTLGVTPGSRDYYGASNFTGGAYDIGAFESSPAASGTASADSFTLRLGPTGNVELFINSPTSAAPTLAWAPAVYTAYAIFGNGGVDSMTLDLSGGNPMPSTGAAFNATSGGHLIVQGATSSNTVALSSTAIVPGGSGPAFSYNGIGDVAVNTGSGDDTIQLTAGGIASAATLNLGGGNDTLSITGGSYVFNADASAISPNLTVNIAAGAGAIFNASQHLAALAIAGSVYVPLGNNKLIVTRSLTIAPTGQLDLSDNTAIVNYTGTSPVGTWNGSAYTGLTGQIATGRNNGTWDGFGIVSSAAMANVARYTVGISEATDALGIPSNGNSTFLTEPVDGTTAIIRFTLMGDSDLTHVITGDDFFRIDTYWGTNQRGFARGDFDYNGKLNSDDYFLIDSNYSHPLT